MSTPTDASPAGVTTKIPFVVLLLALGTFLTATTEFVIAGLLPEVSADLGVGVPEAGLLITAFAIGMIVGAPTIALATMRVPKRSTLITALAVFAAGHVIAAGSSSFAVVLTARVLTALSTGTFVSIAAVVAVAVAGPAASSRAVGVMMSGVALANVVGVPLGSFVGHLIGWRGLFWALGVLAATAALVIGRFIPAEERREAQSVREQFGVLRQGRLWLVLAASALVAGGFISAFSFVSPLLTDRTGLSAGIVPLVLAGFGVGALLGTYLAGRFGDRGPLWTFATTAVSSSVVMLLLIPLSRFAIPTVVLVLLLGGTGMAVTSVATPLAVRFGHSSPALAAALAVSAFNVGSAAGSWLAGMALDSTLGTTGPEVVGAVMAALGLVPVIALATLAGTRTESARVPLASMDKDTFVGTSERTPETLDAPDCVFDTGGERS